MNISVNMGREMTNFQERALSEVRSFLDFRALPYEINIRPVSKDLKGEIWGYVNIIVNITDAGIEVWIYNDEIGYRCGDIPFGTFERLRKSTDDSILEEFFKSLEACLESS